MDDTLRFGPHLALLGTASDVGKSLICAALGRLLSNGGFKVTPFKAQNMSNNAYVTDDGGEIGRAQYVQALACRVAPSVHHNPVLLKPCADNLSQIVVRGQAVGRARASEYFANTQPLREVAFESLRHLAGSHDVVVLEGAGSCAEVNLRSREFVNFPAAHHIAARVVLIADIDRGGVFAQVVGSLEVMPPEDRARVAGVIINKFRGDIRLFDDGVRYLEERTGLPVLGVIPFCYGLDLDSEDAVPIATIVDPPPGTDADKIRVGVIRLPHISNFTDFDALDRVEGVAVHYLYRPRNLADYAAVILPGSKSVVRDLQWLRDTQMADRILEYASGGGKLMGICGGFQMLGRTLLDQDEVESSVPRADGLGLLEAVTAFHAHKVVQQSEGVLTPGNVVVRGYEIHCGRTTVGGHDPLLRLEGGQTDGVRSDRLWATYLHGLFDEAAFREQFLGWIAPGSAYVDTGLSRRMWLDQEIERFAAHVRAHLDWARMEHWVTSGDAPAHAPRRSGTLGSAPRQSGQKNPTSSMANSKD